MLPALHALLCTVTLLVVVWAFFVVLAVLWCSWGEETQAEPGKLLMGLLCITTVFLVCVERLLSFVGVK